MAGGDVVPAHPRRDPAPSHRLLVAAVAAAGVPLALFRDFDSDLFWHLRTGELVLETGRVERGDLFSWTASLHAPPAAFVNHEWLADVVLALLHRLGGFELLVALKALAVGGILLLVAAAARARGAGGLAVPLAMLWALLLVRFRLFVKPEVASLGLAVLFDLLAARHLARGGRGVLVALPLLALLWANLHLQVIAGFLVLGAHVAGEALGRRLGVAGGAGGRGSPGALAAAGAAGALLTLVNPYGVRLYEPALLIYTSPAIGSADVREWRPPTSDGFLLFFLLAGASALVVAATARRARAQDLLLVAGTLLLALRSHRSIGLFAVVSAPVVARHLTLLAGAAGPRLRALLPGLAPRAGPRVRAALLLVLVVAATGTLLSPQASLLHMDQSRHFRFGLGVAERSVPAGTVDLLERAALEGPLYNTYRVGGYLIWRSWPRLRVFLDGRHYVYEGFLEWLRGRSPARVLAELGVRTGLVAYEDGAYLGAFRADPAFALAGFDDVALLFARRDDLARRGVAPFERLRPEDLSLAGFAALPPEGRAELRAEAERAARESPRCVRAWFLLGTLARREGDPARAALAYERALALDPHQASLRSNLGIARLETGRVEEALAEFRRARALDPRLAAAHRNEALAWERLGEPGRAQRARARAERLERSGR